MRDPYSVVGFLGETINLQKLLNLRHPDLAEGDEWTAYDICEGLILSGKILSLVNKAC